MITKESMQKYVDDNTALISVKNQADDTFVLKYKNKVFYKGLWTPEMCELRGTVVDSEFNIIQRPFTKIFNYGEKSAPKFKDDDCVIAPTKVNGFMAAATIHNGELFVSTTGSIISEFADLARKWLTPLTPLFHRWPDFTFIFEIVDPSDPHVVEEKVGAWLLGARVKRWDSLNHGMSEFRLDKLASEFGILRPDWEETTYRKVMDSVRSVTHEGFVIYAADPNDHREIKVKSPFYLTTKFFGRKTEARLNDILENPREAKKIIDEEYYVAIDHLATVKDEFLAMDEQARFAYLREYFIKEIL